MLLKVKAIDKGKAMNINFLTVFAMRAHFTLSF